MDHYDEVLSEKVGFDSISIEWSQLNNVEQPETGSAQFALFPRLWASGDPKCHFTMAPYMRYMEF